MIEKNKVIKKNKIIEAFNVIQKVTEGQFVREGNGNTYLGDDEHYKEMLQLFDKVKPVLLYTRNNKWLIKEYVSENKEYARLVSTLLGFQGQDAYDNKNEELEYKLHIEICIWRSIYK